MQKLRAACNALISLHRAEGFGLNVAEAMAAGMLAIVTDFSGNRDFVNKDNGLPVPYAMRAVEDGEYIYPHGQWWAEPDHEAAVEAMRWAVANPGPAKRLADRGRESILASYSPAAIGRIVMEALAGRSLVAID